MRDYGKVHTSFWSSPTIRSLSEDARTLALYLITSPHTTITGTFRLPDGYVCEDLSWNPERVSKGFTELLVNGFANRCETTKWVWIVKHFEWNQPENPNQVKAAAKVAATIPEECEWRPMFIRACGEILGIKKTEIINPSETVTEPLRNQKQKQEQKKEYGGSDDHAFSEIFLNAWEAYPKRAGDNPKKSAAKCWNARIKSGRTEREMLDGVLRYAEYCRSSGKTGTELVMQAKRFFGVDEAFANAWDSAPQPRKSFLPPEPAYVTLPRMGPNGEGL